MATNTSVIGGGAKMRARRIAIIAPSIRSVMQLRKSVLSKLLDADHVVLVVVPQLDAETQARLDAMGVLHAVFTPATSRIKAYADYKNIQALAAILSDFGADTALCYGAKMMVRGALSAKKASVDHIVTMVTGLPTHRFTGAVAAGDDSSGSYTRAFRASHEIIFHNHDDLRHLQVLGILPEDAKSSVLPGAGVDLDHNAVLELPQLANGLVFLMIARLEAGKGVKAYCAAAKEMKARAPQAKFLLAGPAGQGDDGVGPELWQSEASNVAYLGPLTDVREEIANCHVFVYPSRAEGMPRLVLEAMAAGRPIITCDVAGCRETVDERVNGVLVAPGDVEDLVSAIESFLKRPDLIPSMARASRSKAERRFDQTRADAQLLAALAV
ncbi:MAG: glycosyltransferase family 4 protein [Hyphomicrobiaceae bacterium]